MKKFFLTLSLLLTFIAASFSSPPPDEGMWLPIFIQRLNYTDMQKDGLKLTADEIYSVNNSSLKDAVVIFGGGCTGEIVSDEGLLFTNHHCGFGEIQSHSTVDHDYLKNGFWAKSKEEELLCPDLSVKFLVRIEDVTARITDSLTPAMTEMQRNLKIQAIGQRIVKNITNGTDYIANVRSFFDGNEFYLFVYEEYRDVRFVGAPPSSIGKFGGETDNWMWPRHTGDFSVFRVYMSADGKPSKKYLKDNIPLKPKHYLHISLKGVQKDDYAMIMGYPGRTQRYMTSYGVELAQKVTGPATVKVRTRKLEIMKKDMEAADSIMIKYASKFAGSANGWKFYIGQTRGLEKLKVIEKKKNIEQEFVNWVNADGTRKQKYGNCIDSIRDAYEVVKKYSLLNTYTMEAAFGGSEIIPLALNYEKLYNLLADKKPDQKKITEEAENLKGNIADFFKNYNIATDKKIFIALLQMFNEDVPKDQLPDLFKTISKTPKIKHLDPISNNNIYARYVEYVYGKSIFANQEKLLAFLKNPSIKVLDKDPGYKMMSSFMSNYRGYMALLGSAQFKISKGNRLFFAGIREMQKDRKFYPDANSTMRLTYGNVEDYFPADAIHYNYYTTLDGIMEKEDPNNDEFTVPEKLKTLYKNKDYGRYGETLASGERVLKVCFLTNNDITGGNSGSPVLDGDGNLLGLAFDGNWEAMSGNIAFEPDLQRTICVDIRYVLFIIDKYANAQNLVKEIKIAE